MEITKILTITHVVQDVVADFASGTASLRIQNTGNNRIYFVQKAATVTTNQQGNEVVTRTNYVKGTLKNLPFLDPEQVLYYVVEENVLLCMYCAGMDVTSTIAIDNAFSFNIWRK